MATKDNINKDLFLPPCHPRQYSLNNFFFLNKDVFFEKAITVLKVIWEIPQSVIPPFIFKQTFPLKR